MRSDVRLAGLASHFEAIEVDTETRMQHLDFVRKASLQTNQTRSINYTGGYKQSYYFDSETA